MGCHSPFNGVPEYAVKVRVSPVASQCGADSTKFLQWHSSVGLFQKVFPVVFQCTLQVLAGSPNGIPVYTGSTSGIPVYTGPASVHWLRVRVGSSTWFGNWFWSWVMTWCRQATSHYLSSCWPSFLSPYGVKSPEWVNSRILWFDHLVLNVNLSFNQI